ncbi:hypothetical protein WJX81_006200 [Elliptochloris bilobata]|uniref:F-box domain-containing protein n=1 Tax=Elliptochloris bilobata TaxID=381761 RepID=A0AAW1RJU9_9CHLO
MGLGASAAQVVAQADVQSNVPHLPEELLVGHVLPHLGDRPLAAAACVARIWRRMAGERGRGEVAYMHGSAGRAPVFTATFAAHVRTERRGGRGSMAALALRELRALQPGWLAAQLAEADARFWYSSWPELDAAAAAEL